LICDRIRPISELVYGNVLRGFSMLGEDEALRWVDHFVSVIIYCRPSLQVIQANVEASFPNQMSGVVEHTPRLVEEYDRIMLRYASALHPPQYYQYSYHNDADGAALTAMIESLSFEVKGQTHEF